MRHDVPRWLRELALALDHASTEADAPGGNLHGLWLRCNDTIAMGGYIQPTSLLDLIDRFAGDLREYPTVVPEPLLRTLIEEAR